jgi:hypothetical protein
MPDEQPNGTRIRKRRVTKQRRQETLLDRFRKPQGGVLVAGLMLMLAVGYGAYGAAVAGKVARGYAGLELGASRAEVSYLLGAPPAGQEQAARWNFAAPGFAMAAQFGADGRLEQIACSMPAAVTSSLCPPVYGIVPGAGEVDLEATLGRPSTITLAGTHKIYAYDGLGLHFKLAQRQVVEIEHRTPAMGADFARSVLWQLLP